MPLGVIYKSSSSSSPSSACSSAYLFAICAISWGFRLTASGRCTIASPFLASLTLSGEIWEKMGLAHVGKMG